MQYGQENVPIAISVDSLRTILTTRKYPKFRIPRQNFLHRLMSDQPIKSTPRPLYSFSKFHLWHYTVNSKMFYMQLPDPIIGLPDSIP
ncbi:hypothetical protein TNCT_215261 [Trichonephila clavata]|uniref:Uncharacterized protein n=1 Tax=Trichonephila clavata TaxID=2740835 RepID=A0A8X6L0C4_TRICU|nr:hypothetical protein TNCT_215261 [Trichonephila clavata]